MSAGAPLEKEVRNPFFIIFTIGCNELDSYGMKYADVTMKFNFNYFETTLSGERFDGWLKEGLQNRETGHLHGARVA